MTGLTSRIAAAQCSHLCIAVSLLSLVVSHTGILFPDPFARVPLASPSKLLDHVLGDHATAPKLCSCIHQFKEGVLSLLANDADILQLNHQRTVLDFPFPGPPSAPQFPAPSRHYLAFKNQPTL